jgi:ribosome maturation factor RimP
MESSLGVATELDIMAAEQEGKEKQIRAAIWDLVEPVIEAAGLELIEVEYQREPHGWVLRLFIDREEGVGLDDCAQMSRVIGDLMDVTDPVPNAYHLELSSPGLNRPLRRPQHYKKYIGQVIELRTIVPAGSRRKFKGILLAADDSQITLECAGQAHLIQLSNVEKARLRYFESQERA